VIVGYQLVQAVLVATLGRLGDMHARVRAYDAGLRRVHRRVGAALVRSLRWRERSALANRVAMLQAFGGSILSANSAAILIDAFPAHQRGLALETHLLAGRFIGLLPVHRTTTLIAAPPRARTKTRQAPAVTTSSE